MFSDRDKEKIQILNYQMHLRNLESICATFSAERIEPILIKGLAAAQNYPHKHQRTFSDLDLACEPKKFNRARTIIYKSRYPVDLHLGLRHLDTLGWEDLFERSKFMEVGGERIRVLCAEDHLRVLCVHWLNDGGTDRTRLWDIYFALRNKPPDFEWDRFLRVVDERRSLWLITVVLLTKYYFGLELEGTDFKLLRYELPDWLIKEIEKEWGSDERLIPLHQVLHDKKRFIRQVFKRVPPNALQAAVETGSHLRDDHFYFVRAHNLLARVKPSVKRILKIED